MPTASQEITLSEFRDSRSYWGTVLSILPRTHHVVLDLEAGGVNALCVQTQETRIFPWNTRARIIKGERLLEFLCAPANQRILKLTYERYPDLQRRLERAAESV